MFVDHASNHSVTESQPSTADIGPRENNGLLSKLGRCLRSLCCPCQTNALQAVQETSGRQPIIQQGCDAPPPSSAYDFGSVAAYDLTSIDQPAPNVLDIGRKVVANIRATPIQSVTTLILNGGPMSDDRFNELSLEHDVLVAGDLCFLFELQDKVLDDKAFEAFVDHMGTSRKSGGQLIANCGELAAMAAKQLKAQGVNTLALVSVSPSDDAFEHLELPEGMDLDTARRSFTLGDYGQYSAFERFMLMGGHSFVVANLDESADIHRPETWGDQAVMVDPWLDVVMPIKEGLNYISQVFAIPDNEPLEYTDMLEGGLFSTAECDIQTNYSWNVART